MKDINSNLLHFYAIEYLLPEAAASYQLVLGLSLTLYMHIMLVLPIGLDL